MNMEKAGLPSVAFFVVLFCMICVGVVTCISTHVITKIRDIHDGERPPLASKQTEFAPRFPAPSPNGNQALSHTELLNRLLDAARNVDEIISHYLSSRRSSSDLQKIHYEADREDATIQSLRAIVTALREYDANEKATHP